MEPESSVNEGYRIFMMKIHQSDTYFFSFVLSITPNPSAVYMMWRQVYCLYCIEGVVIAANALRPFQDLFSPEFRYY